MTTPRIISYGGGVQSTAMIVLAVTGEIDADGAVFVNVGDRAESPETLGYVRDVAIPWAAGHGFTVTEVRRIARNGQPFADLYDYTIDTNNRSIPIPVRGANGAPGRRSCTVDWKIKVIERHIRSLGATVDAPVDVLVGISTDEIERAKPWPGRSVQRQVWPLLDLGISRDRCRTIIADAGLPIPPKSACWFCPMQSPRSWAETRRDNPDRFTQAVEFEAAINRKRHMNGKDDVTLSRIPLADIAEAQTPLPFETEGCDEGGCFT